MRNDESSRFPIRGDERSSRALEVRVLEDIGRQIERIVVLRRVECLPHGGGVWLDSSSSPKSPDIKLWFVNNIVRMASATAISLGVNGSSCCREARPASPRLSR